MRKTGKNKATGKDSRKSGFRYKKKYGQNFLHDTVKIQRIISAVSPGSEDVFLEIGPGSGNLTKELAPLVQKVIAVEIDPEAVEKLNERKIKNLEIVNTDIMDFDFSAEKGIRVIGNIPYYITVPILEMIINNRDKVRDVFLTVQKEVAERICAREGSKVYGSLSVFIQYYADAEKIFKIGRKAFFPVPKVDSAFIGLKFREGKIKVKSEELFFRLVRGAFGVRRKTLANGIRKTFGIKQEEAADVLSSAGIPPNIRPEQVSILDFAKISDLLYNMKNI